MTTIFGIRHNEVNASVLAGDRQGTFPDRYEKVPLSKLYIDNSKEFAFGFAGSATPQLEDLTKKLQEGNINIEKIVSEGIFNELRELNIEQMGGYKINNQYETGMLLATRFGGNCQLYTCWPLGKVEPRECTYVGSGSDYIQQYLSALNVRQVINPKKPRKEHGVEDIIRIGLEGVKYAASKDLFSNGLDLVVVTPDTIKDHSDDLEDNTFKRKVRKIQKQYEEK